MPKPKRSRQTSTSFIINNFYNVEVSSESQESNEPRVLTLPKKRIKVEYPEIDVEVADAAVAPMPQPAPVLPANMLASQRAFIKKLGIQKMAAEDYISSPYDQSHLVKVKPVNILMNAGNQRHYGLYAAVDISKETVIGEYTGEISFVSEQDPAADNPPNNYQMILNNEYIFDASKKGNFTRYINQSDCQPNVNFVQQPDQKFILAIANQNIPKDCQLLADASVFRQDSEATLFLNPSDNEITTSKIYKTFKKDYYGKVYKFIKIPELKVEDDDKYYVTKIVYDIRRGNSLTVNQVIADVEAVNLPCIAIKPDGSLYDFAEKDTFTALMLACLDGSFADVVWLVDQGARVNQQQNHSGQYALSLALAGYNKNPHMKDYVNIFQHLIRHGASVLLRDKEDVMFINKASKWMYGDDFDNLLKFVQAYQPEEFNVLPDYTNENGDDFMLYCLKAGDVYKFVLAAKYYQPYLIEKLKDNQYMSKVEEYSKQLGPDDIKNAEEEIPKLKKSLGNKLMAIFKNEGPMRKRANRK